MVFPFNWSRRKRQSKAKIRWDMVNARDSSASVAPFACDAAAYDYLIKLLRNAIRCGGGVTLAIISCSGKTVQHVSLNKEEIYKILLDHGADITKPYTERMTPRYLADQLGRVDIKSIFDSAKELKAQSSPCAPEKQIKTSYLGRATTEPAMPLSHESSVAGTNRSCNQSHSTLRSANFHNSLSYNPSNGADSGVNLKRYRVVISCPEKSKTYQCTVFLPGTFKELLELGTKIFGMSPLWIVSKELRGRIDEIDVICDGDHLVFVSFYPKSTHHVNLINSLIDGMDSAVNRKSYRAVISCPEKSDIEPLLVLLPGSFKELLELGARKFGICPVRIISKKHGSRIDDIDVIRNNDHLVFVGALP